MQTLPAGFGKLPQELSQSTRDEREGQGLYQGRGGKGIALGPGEAKELIGLGPQNLAGLASKARGARAGKVKSTGPSVLWLKPTQNRPQAVGAVV